MLKYQSMPMTRAARGRNGVFRAHELAVYDREEELELTVVSKRFGDSYPIRFGLTIKEAQRLAGILSSMARAMKERNRPNPCAMQVVADGH